MLTLSEERASPWVTNDTINDGKLNVLWFRWMFCANALCEIEPFSFIYSLIYIIACYGNDNNWHMKDRFSGFRRRVSSWGPSRKLQNSKTYHLPNGRRCYMAGILQIRVTTINQSIVFEYVSIYMDLCYDNVTKIFVSHNVGFRSGCSSMRTITNTLTKQEARKIRFWTMHGFPLFVFVDILATVI